MTEPIRFDILFILQTIGKNRRTVLFLTALALVAGIVVSMIKPKKYEATTEFFLKNPLYAERVSLYNTEPKLIDYFASEDDLERIVSMSESDSVQTKVIKDMQIDREEGSGLTDSAAAVRAKKKFASCLKIKRSGEKTLILSYTDKDAVRASRIANYCVLALQNAMQEFYNGTRLDMVASVTRKIKDEDSTVAALTDTMITLRNKYDIFDIVSPTRYLILTQGHNETRNASYAEGLEKIQNIESIKDEMVVARARHITLINQYTTGVGQNELPLISMIKAAAPPEKTKGPGMLLITAAATICGFFFSVCFILLASYYRQLTASYK